MRCSESSSCRVSDLCHLVTSKASNTGPSVKDQRSSRMDPQISVIKQPTSCCQRTSSERALPLSDLKLSPTPFARSYRKQHHIRCLKSEPPQTHISFRFPGVNHTCELRNTSDKSSDQDLALIILGGRALRTIILLSMAKASTTTNFCFRSSCLFHVETVDAKSNLCIGNQI